MSAYPDYFGWRMMILENIISECVSAIQNGRTDIVISRSDITNDELEYIKQEVERRLR